MLSENRMNELPPAATSVMTPREIVQELDQHIVGQASAKRAVAVALRNRWRRSRIEGPMRSEIHPKNILMIGPTGVGKTERSEEHTYELQSLMRISYAVFCLKKKNSQQQ